VRQEVGVSRGFQPATDRARAVLLGRSLFIETRLCGFLHTSPNPSITPETPDTPKGARGRHSNPSPFDHDRRERLASMLTVRLSSVPQ
jgi:hypothetical protein